MNILMVAAELTPIAKTGGLADAVAGLSRALVVAGHDVRILMPDYDGTENSPQAIPLADGSQLIEYKKATDSLAVWLHRVPGIGTPAHVYFGDDRDGRRYACLANAAASFSVATSWPVDIFHCHDWHAALVPDALKSANETRAAATVLTIHNLGYQGDYSTAALSGRGLGKFLSSIRASDSSNRINFLRRGITQATAISTVSPTYAQEILSPEYGMGLDPLLATRKDRLTGILNGVDYDCWDPRIDPNLTIHYDKTNISPKLAIKANLCAELGLHSTDAPLFGLVSRLAEQKGIDIFAGALEQLLESTNATFAVLGSGEADLEERIRSIAALSPARVGFANGYNEKLAHLVIAGSDSLLVPSRYEPCGLTQLYAMRYGTVPIVRATGGLADTVQHFNPSTGRGNGCVFSDADVNAVIWAVTTTIGWYSHKPAWQVVVANAMNEEHAWLTRVPEYQNLYKRALNFAEES